MGKNNSIQPDVILKHFWRDNRRFADLFNAVIFKGEQVINPDELKEMDTDVSEVIKLKGYSESIKRNRDIVKKMCNGVEFNILGLELQDRTHYAMPLRTMIYDGLGYVKEYNDIKNKGIKERTAEEFLSGMGQNDKLHPIITIVLYYGETPWNGPVSLYDMMTGLPDNMKQFFSDYRLNLIQILESDKYIFYNEDVKDVFNITRNIYQKNFQNIYKEYNNKLVDSEVLDLIGVITSSKALLGINREQRKGGGIDMCTALEELRMEIENQGVQKGIEQERNKAIIAMLELGLTKEQILTKYSKEEIEEAEQQII